MYLIFIQTFVAYGGERAHLLLNDDAPKPNAQCGVCSTSYVGLKVDTTTFTLGNFLEKVLINSKRGLGLLGEIAIMLGDGLIYDVDFDENIDSSFSDLGINHGKQLMITNDHDEDESENKCVVVFISHDEHVKGFQISGDTRNLQSRPIAEKVLEKSDLKRKAEHVDLDDEVLVID